MCKLDVASFGGRNEYILYTIPTTERQAQYMSYVMRTGTYLLWTLQHSIPEHLKYFHDVYKGSSLYLKDGTM